MTQSYFQQPPGTTLLPMQGKAKRYHMLSMAQLVALDMTQSQQEDDSINTALAYILCLLHGTQLLLMQPSFKL